MENIDLLRIIIEYVGPKQYLVVATINQSFREAHSIAFFKDKDTYYNASTVELAKYCFNDLVATNCNTKSCSTAKSDNLTERKSQRALCSSAAKCGNLLALQYLRSLGCDWDE